MLMSEQDFQSSAGFEKHLTTVQLIVYAKVS